jgi:hypothetical protein
MSSIIHNWLSVTKYYDFDDDIISWLEHKHNNQDDYKNYEETLSHYFIRKKNNEYVLNPGWSGYKVQMIWSHSDANGWFVCFSHFEITIISIGWLVIWSLGFFDSNPLNMFWSYMPLLIILFWLRHLVAVRSLDKEFKSWESSGEHGLNS